MCTYDIHVCGCVRKNECCTASPCGLQTTYEKQNDICYD